RLYARRFALESDSDARRVDELQRDHQSDRWFHRPGQPERRRTAERGEREFRSEPGDGILDAVGDDGHGHASRDLHAHDHRYQRQPDAYHYGLARRGRGRKHYAGRFTFEPDGDARSDDGLPGDHQSEVRLRRQVQPVRRRTAERGQPHFPSAPVDRSLDAVSDDGHGHAGRGLHAHDHRYQRQPDAYHYGLAHGGDGTNQRHVRQPSELRL